MKYYTIQPSQITGDITIPSSKSHTLRAILFGALAKGKSVIHHALASPDTSAMIDACRLFGAKISPFEDHLEIEGVAGCVNHFDDVVQAHNSGIVLRFITAIGSLSSSPMIITGDHSIRHQRPMHPLTSALQQLGVSVISTKGDGFAPLIVQGPLKSGKAIIDGKDSQPVSALLIAAIFAQGPIEINVHNPGETPWIALTLDWLKRLGVPFQQKGFEHYSLHGGGGYAGFEYTVPGDWSTAAFPLAAALVTQSELTLHNVDFDDCQGDKALVDVFQRMGARLHVNQEQRTLRVEKGSELSGVDVDINSFIDALPILAAVACYAQGETHIRNAAIARTKECDRIHCIAKELRKMGGEIIEHPDGLTIRPVSLKGSIVKSHDDHRVAMSLAVASLGAEGTTQVRDIACVDKTFATFSCDFKKLGANIEIC